MKIFIQLTLVLFCVCLNLCAQVSEIDRLMQNELKMTFPSIYFKHNSTEYAAMPYTADSCYKYIAKNFKADVTELVIWRDSAETEQLTLERIKIIKAGIRKYLKKGKISIKSMGDEQKVSRYTISLTTDSTKISYLLSLNSSLDFSNTNFPVKKKSQDHVMRPRIGCINCWLACFHIVERHKRKKKERLQRKG